MATPSHCFGKSIQVIVFVDLLRLVRLVRDQELRWDVLPVVSPLARIREQQGPRFLDGVFVRVDSQHGQNGFLEVVGDLLFTEEQGHMNGGTDAICQRRQWQPWLGILQQIRTKQGVSPDTIDEASMEPVA